MTTPRSPLDLLLPYQRKNADDNSRFKYSLQARQTGKDFTAGAEGVRDCYEHEVKGEKVDWLIGAPSERQSLESLEKWKEWTEAFKLAIDDIVEVREDEHNSESLLKSNTIIFPGGSRVIAVPGKPNTVRGYSANVVLTEFAFFEDPDATWRAIFPSVNNPLRGGLKKMRVVTTPNGIGNKSHELWMKNYNMPGAKWSCHRVTIHDAVAQGLPVDIEELRAALDDPEGWAQEYECEFIDTASVLLPYEMIALCENPMATTGVPLEFWLTAGQTPRVLGVDFGRKKDLTCGWTLDLISPHFAMTREVFELANASTRQQLDLLRPRVATAVRTCFDYTGPGVGLGDLLVDEFGEWNPEQHKFGKVELCTFTDTFKREIFPKLRLACDQKELGVPINRTIREDLHSVHRITTKTGVITYRAPHTKDGHADRTVALALANRARALGGISMPIHVFGNTRTSRIVEARRDRTVYA